MSEMTYETGSSSGEGGARDKAQQVAGQAQEKAQQVAGQAQEKAQEMKSQAGERVREQVNTRSTEAGVQLQSTADAMRRTGQQLREDGKEGPAKVTDMVAERAERLGNYMTDVDADRMLRDVERFARRQPWLVAAGGAVVGFFASRFMKASSSRRYETESGGGGYSAQPALPAGPTPTYGTTGYSDIDAPVAGEYGDAAYMAPAIVVDTDEPVSTGARGATRGESRGEPGQ